MYQEPDDAEDTEVNSDHEELDQSDFSFELDQYGEVINERDDNIRRSAFIRLMIYLKIFFKVTFGLNFDSFNCQKVFGSSLGNFKEMMKWKIYQLLCLYPENEKTLIQYLETENKKSEKLKFFYFMTRTYEELYKRYIEGNINFPIFPNGTLRICNFITLEKVIKETKKVNYHYAKKFESISRSMLHDIETKARNKKNGAQKNIQIKNITIFEYMRDHFSEETKSSGLELEEK